MAFCRRRERQITLELRALKPSASSSEAHGTPNPKRVAAGRRNRLKRKGLTPEGRQRLREAALKNKPWLHSTGPKTPEGKMRAAQNGSWCRPEAEVPQELRKELEEERQMNTTLFDIRRLMLDDHCSRS